MSSPLSNEALLAEVAFATYLKPDEVKNYLLDRTDLTKVDYFSVEGCEGVVASNDEIVVVGFAGTNPRSLMDLVTDLNALQVVTVYGKVHSGAHRYYEMVRDLVSDLIDTHRNNSQSLRVCGHSLGGMIARDFCCDYQETYAEEYVIDLLVDFGCPNTGDDLFQTSVSKSTKRHLHFVNNCDIFPRMPPKKVASQIGLGYTSPKTINYLTYRGNLLSFPPIAWWIIWVDRLVGRMADIGVWKTKGLKDHAMGEYLRKVKKVFK